MIPQFTIQFTNLHVVVTGLGLLHTIFLSINTEHVHALSSCGNRNPHPRRPEGDLTVCTMFVSQFIVLQHF